MSDQSMFVHQHLSPVLNLKIAVDAGPNPVVLNQWATAQKWAARGSLVGRAGLKVKNMEGDK